MERGLTFDALHTPLQVVPIHLRLLFPALLTKLATDLRFIVFRFLTPVTQLSVRESTHAFIFCYKISIERVTSLLQSPPRRF